MKTPRSRPRIRLVIAGCALLTATSIFAHTWATPRVLKTVVKGRVLTITTEVMLPTPCTTVGKRVKDSTSTSHSLTFWGIAQKGNCVTMIAHDTVNVSLNLHRRGTHTVSLQGTTSAGGVRTDTTLTVRVKH